MTVLFSFVIFIVYYEAIFNLLLLTKTKFLFFQIAGPLREGSLTQEYDIKRVNIHIHPKRFSRRD